MPAKMPHTIPDEVPTVAIVGLLMLHEPPVVRSLNVVHIPSHTEVVPVIAAGNGFTVTFAVALQPVVVDVAAMVTTPLATPVTIPVVAPTVAIPVLLLLHVTSVDEELNVVVVPGHKVSTPVIAPGKGLTVTTVVR